MKPGAASVSPANGVQILIVVGAGNAVSANAGRRGVEPGMVVVVLAAAASFIPGVPRLELDSELIHRSPERSRR